MESARDDWLLSILTMESARGDWLLVHSHNGEHALRLDEGRPTILRQVAPQRPHSVSGMWWQKINAVLDTLQRGNTSPALTNSSQEPRCKLRAIGNREKSNRYAQRGARTHDPEIKSLMLYRLS